MTRYILVQIFRFQGVAQFSDNTSLQMRDNPV
jgi:hypothetical protein